MFFNKTKKELEEAQDQIAELDSRLEAIGCALNGAEMQRIPGFICDEWRCNGELIPRSIAQKIIDLRKRGEVKTEEFPKVYAARLAYWRDRAKGELQPQRSSIVVDSHTRGRITVYRENDAQLEKDYAQALRDWGSSQEYVLVGDKAIGRQEIIQIYLDRGKTYTELEIEDWAIEHLAKEMKNWRVLTTCDPSEIGVHINIDTTQLQEALNHCKSAIKRVMGV